MSLSLKNATVRAARPDPSLRKCGLLGMTILRDSVVNSVRRRGLADRNRRADGPDRAHKGDGVNESNDGESSRQTDLRHCPDDQSQRNLQ